MLEVKRPLSELDELVLEFDKCIEVFKYVIPATWRFSSAGLGRQTTWTW